MLSSLTVIVTGAGSGLGRGYATGLCGDQARVIGISRDRENLETTALACGDRFTYVAGDITDEQDRARLVSLVESLGSTARIALVNNAAVHPRKTFLELSEEDWRQTVAVNLLAAVSLIREVLPIMQRNAYGRIVNVGSYAWVSPGPEECAYAVTKGGLRALTRSLAASVDRGAYPDILINELVPGMVRTGMSPVGLEPIEAYRFLRSLLLLPAGGPHGETFDRDVLEGVRKPFLRRLASKVFRLS